MKKYELTVPAQILMYLFTATSFIPKPFESKTRYLKRQLFGKVPYESYYTALCRLEQAGLITILKERKSKFIKLTEKGQLEALFQKARVFEKPESWDGKWRLVIFDIPEDARDKRELLRILLRANGFELLQASVFVSPHPINREAVSYLQKTGLSTYIRIIKVEEMDNDKDLKKKFGLE